MTYGAYVMGPYVRMARVKNFFLTFFVSKKREKCSSVISDGSLLRPVTYVQSLVIGHCYDPSLMTFISDTPAMARVAVGSVVAT